MTNEAISAILEHLSNEARNSAHTTFGVMELLGEMAVDSNQRESLAFGTASADRLLRSLDDVRDLLSSAPPAQVRLEEFDLAMCVAEIVEMLNLASGRRTKRLVLDAPVEPLMVAQDRKAVEEVFTRVLDTAFKLAQTSTVHVPLSRIGGERRARLAVAARDANLAMTLAGWLNANPDQATLQGRDDVAFGIAVMVAGKRLRGLGGSAELVRDAAGHSAVALDLSSRATGTEDLSSTQLPQSDALKVLVAEDCDESFALTELMLQTENVGRARDGREALQMIQKQRFDVVLMDVHMPGMDGYSAIRGIRDWETHTGNARIPIVILSSDDLETQRRSAAQSGCSGFLRKPMRRRELAVLLDRIKGSRILTA